MKLTIKTFKQEIFKIVAEENETVLDLKKKLQAATNQQFPYERICLIYSGAILDNDKKLSTYNIDENKFLVAMIKPPITETKKSEQDLPNEDQPVTSTDCETEELEATFMPSESLTVPADIETAINNIVTAMGYSRAEVQQAFNVSFNNPDRAVEYLLSGIPADLMTQRRQIQMNLQNDNVSPDNSENIEVSNVNTNRVNNSPLSFLLQDPRFLQMRELLQENPNLLETVISQIAESNTSLLQLIRDNQEDFINMINEPISASTSDADNENENAIEINIRPDDLLAIGRLQELGFNESNCIEAYFACEKNEEMAANYLFTHFG